MIKFFGSPIRDAHPGHVAEGYMVTFNIGHSWSLWVTTHHTLPGEYMLL